MMEKGRRFVDERKWNLVVSQNIQVKWIVVFTLFFYSLSLFQPAFIALAKPTDKPSPVRFGGNFRYQHKDVLIPAPGFQIAVIRTYNSKSQSQGLFGYGWQFDFDLRILKIPGGKHLYLLDGDGSILSFKFDTTENAYTSRGKGWQTITELSYGGYQRTLPGGRYHIFDSAGRLLKMSDLNGNELTLTYSGDGKLLKILASSGQWLEFFYDSSGNISRITDPLNHSYTYQVDIHGDLTSASDPLGRTTRYRYDVSHNLVEIRYPDKSIKKLTYDTKDDLLLDESGPGSTHNQFSYDSKTLSFYITDSRHKKTKITYTPDYKKQTITDPLGGKTVQEFDDDHLLILHRDPAGNETRFKYDGHGNLKSATNAPGHSAQFTYDTKLNLPVSVIDSLGRRSQIKYDARGNLTALINPDGSRQLLTYSKSGQIKEIINENGHKTYYQYNKSGYLTKIFDNMGAIYQAQYDQVGQLIKRINPDGTWVSFRYSPSGKVTATSDSGSRTNRYIYDNMDRLIGTVDPEGNGDIFTYNRNGKLSSHKDPLEHKTLFDYDPAGNLTQLTDANGNITLYRYDDLNRMTEKIDAGNNRFKYEYNLNGRLIAATDAKGQTIRYSYNPLVQLVNKQYPDGSTVYFFYNPAGELTSVQGPNTSHFYTYDSLNRLVSKQDDLIGQTVRYTYDAAGNVIKVTGPEDQTVQYRYNGRGRMTAVIDPRGEKTEYIYDKSGRRSLVKHANMTFSRFQYDRLGRLSGILHKTDSGELISSFEYAYDVKDNRISVTVDNRETRKFGYDVLDRLIKETTPGGETISYEYDPMGNRLAAVGKKRRNYKYDSLNHLIESGKIKYRYDANGDLIRKATPKGSTQYSYDAEKNLTGVELPDGQKYLYRYNAFGDRTSRDGPEGKTFYLHDREDVLAEFGSGKKLDRLYLHGPGFDDLAGVITGGERYTVHTDGLGSLVALADKGQQVVSQYDYSAFGEVEPVKEAVAIPFLFTGARYDAESGLHHMRSRAYDPDIGRFISPDRIDVVGGINLYAYANNNPVNFIDPLGFITPLHVLGGAVAIEAVNRLILKPAFGVQLTAGVSIGGQASSPSGFGGKGGLNIQYFGLDRRTDLYAVYGAVLGHGAAGGPTFNVALVKADAEWKGNFNSADVTGGLGSISAFTSDDFSAVGIEFGGKGGFAAHASRTYYQPLITEPILTPIADWLFGGGQSPSPSPPPPPHTLPLPPPGPTTQPPPPPPHTPPTLPVGNEACLNGASGPIANAREKAASARSSIENARRGAGAVQTSAQDASRTANSANQKVSAANRVVAACEALPVIYESPATAQSATELAAEEGKSLVSHAASHSTEACGMVQKARAETNEAARRIWQTEAAGLITAIRAKAGKLTALIENAESAIQTAEREESANESAKQQARQAIGELSSASNSLNTAEAALNGMDGKITEAQGQLGTARSEAGSANGFKEAAHTALSRCSPNESLRNEINSIQVPDESQIEGINNDITTASTALANAKASVSSAISAVTQKMQDLQDCAGLESGATIINAAKAALARAKASLVQIKVEGEVAASCANEIAAIIDSLSSEGGCPEYDPTNPACEPGTAGDGNTPVDTDKVAKLGDDFQENQPWSRQPEEGGATGDGEPVPQGDYGRSPERETRECERNSDCQYGQTCQEGKCVASVRPDYPPYPPHSPPPDDGVGEGRDWTDWATSGQKPTGGPEPKEPGHKPKPKTKTKTTTTQPSTPTGTGKGTGCRWSGTFWPLSGLEWKCYCSGKESKTTKPCGPYPPPLKKKGAQKVDGSKFGLDVWYGMWDKANNRCILWGKDAVVINESECGKFGMK